MAARARSQPGADDRQAKEILLKRILLTTALFAVAALSHANEERAPANFTGPLVTPNPSNLPPGLLNVQPYLVYQTSNSFYDNQGRKRRSNQRTDQWSVLLPMAVGLTPRIQAQLIAGAVRTLSGDARSDGFRSTDTNLVLQYLIQKPADDGRVPAIAINIGHRFPTGRHDRLDDNLLNGSGQGVSVNTVALLAQQILWLGNGRPLRWRARLIYGQAASRVSINGASVYGTEAGFRGFASVGQRIGASVAAEYSISPRWNVVMEATYDHRAGGRVHGTAPGEAAPIVRNTPSGSLYTLAPAVEYHLNSRFGFIGGVQFSVGGRNNDAFVAPQVAFNMVF